MTEMVIQQLLLDAGASGVDQDLVDGRAPQGLEVAADWRTLQSPETYVGYRQATGFAQEDVARFDEPHAYAAPARLPLNDWGLAGDWTVGGARGRLERAGGADRVPVPRARRQPRDGTGDAGRVDPVPGLPRRPAGRRTPPGPTSPPTAAGSSTNSGRIS